MKKRGAIEVQFNWIFVLIAGGLILAFFVMVANTYMKTAGFEAEAKLRSNMDSVINNAKHSPGTIFEVTMKKANLEYKDCYRGISVGDRVAEIPVRTAFGPDLIKSTLGKIYLWAVDWNMPYKVDNFIFITSPDVRYVIVNSSTTDNSPLEKLAIEVYNGTQAVSLPQRINKVIVKRDQLPNLQASNYYKTIFIFFDTPTGALHSSFAEKGIEASRLLIDPKQDGLDGWGDLIFEKKIDEQTNFGPAESSKYLGRASVFAAIFAENATMYECGMRQAVNRLRAVTTIYMGRTGNMQANITGDCSTANLDIYPKSWGLLNIMLSDTNTFSIGKFADMYQNAAELKVQNQRATMYSCPLIY